MLDIFDLCVTAILLIILEVALRHAETPESCGYISGILVLSLVLALVMAVNCARAHRRKLSSEAPRRRRPF